MDADVPVTYGFIYGLMMEGMAGVSLIQFWAISYSWIFHGSQTQIFKWTCAFEPKHLKSTIGSKHIIPDIKIEYP